jgi:hypothetical protein
LKTQSNGATTLDDCELQQQVAVLLDQLKKPISGGSQPVYSPDENFDLSSRGLAT